MNILLAVECEATAYDSTFTFISYQQKSLLLQFSPDFHLHSLSLGEIFQENGIQGVKDFFEKNFQLVIDGSVVLQEKNLLQLLNSYFPKGIPGLTASQLIADPKEFSDLLAYQQNMEGPESTFVYQQHFLRILKNQIIRKRNLLKMNVITRQLVQYMTTDISQQQLLKLLLSLVRQSASLEKYVFPLENTYRILPAGQKQRLKMVDVGQNERLLRNFLQGALLKES
ncbi:hypothetical protein ACYSNU_08345 [Enterococcus sp. LJL120]